MKRFGILIAIILLGALLPWTTASATDDGMYHLLAKDTDWDGTYASRTIAPIAAPAGASNQYDYDYTYGDDASITYTLPWSFSFYGTPYSQITVDTNGNVWFGSGGAAHSFNLASNGRGPVIAAWNDDLSSYYYGGVFIQHKTDVPKGDRVVIEWQTETYTEAGYSQSNNFEIVLYPNGNIRIDYYAFSTTAGKDMGSGISNNSDKHISITSDAAFGPVYGLAGRSLQFDVQKQVSVSFAGNGSGSVSSSPAGLNCTANCSALFAQETSVTLSATAGSGSAFTGWSGGMCAGTSPCTFTANDNMATTATFGLLPTADYSVVLSSSSAPALATFTDNSTNATSWSWNFDDGTTSSLRSPTHVYKNSGSYTVTHTATNAAGSTSTTQVITVTACSTQPVKNGSTYYATLQAAYDAAAAGALIQTLATGLTESLLANRNIDVAIEGGYLCGFPENPPGETTISGMSQIDDGTVRMTNIVVQE